MLASIVLRPRSDCRHTMLVIVTVIVIVIVVVARARCACTQALACVDFRRVLRTAPRVHIVFDRSFVSIYLEQHFRVRRPGCSVCAVVKLNTTPIGLGISTPLTAIVVRHSSIVARSPSLATRARTQMPHLGDMGPALEPSGNSSNGRP